MISTSRIFLWRLVPSVALAAGVTLFIAMSGCSDSTSADGEGEDFAVHEWGVMVGCDSDSSFFATSRPEMSAAIRIPVIYIHSHHKTPFTVRVKFTDGDSIVTYPDATASSDSAVWEDVGFSASAEAVFDTNMRGYEPLEDIIPTLNNVDADMLEYYGVKSRFLFYEGKSKFRNEIAVLYTFDGLGVTLRNESNHTCYDVILVDRAGLRLPDGPSPYFVAVDSLAAGEEVTQQFALMETHPDMVEKMTALGFTASEANSFSELWDLPFFTIDDPGARANLIYRLPQAQYYELISLDIEPEPDEIIRAMYILVHVGE